MSENQGAIPKLIVFVLLLVLGILFNLPDDINIGIIILEAFRPAVQNLGDEMASNVLELQILFLRILGFIFFVIDALIIVTLFRKKEYW